MSLKTKAVLGALSLAVASGTAGGAHLWPVLAYRRVTLVEEDLARVRQTIEADRNLDKPT